MAYFNSRLVGFCHTNAHPSHSALFGLGLSNLWGEKYFDIYTKKEINDEEKVSILGKYML